MTYTGIAHKNRLSRSKILIKQPISRAILETEQQKENWTRGREGKRKKKMKLQQKKTNNLSWLNRGRKQETNIRYFKSYKRRVGLSFTKKWQNRFSAFFLGGFEVCVCICVFYLLTVHVQTAGSRCSRQQYVNRSRSCNFLLRGSCVGLGLFVFSRRLRNRLSFSSFIFSPFFLSPTPTFFQLIWSNGPPPNTLRKSHYPRSW
jgi:hypothetical protein